MRDIGAEYRGLHKWDDPTLANAWDMGSAKLPTASDAQAIVTAAPGSESATLLTVGAKE